jgi:thymidylate synthase
MTATETWRRLLTDLLDLGAEVAPASLGGDWRGRTTRELLARQTTIDMNSPVLTCPGRRLGYRFMTAEAAWILAGDNRLAAIEPYARQLAKLSDDGFTMTGAYGPPFVDQLPYVQRALTRDPASRQAVMTIWRPRPGADADVPCTVALQWLIRADRLHCAATMRSSDAWMGLPYDWFTFSAMSAFLALRLRKTHPGLWLGALTVTAGSQHLYRIDWDVARECAGRTDESPAVAPIDLAEFDSPDALVRHLWCVARAEPDQITSAWLTEVMK